MGYDQYLYPSSVGLGQRRHIPAAGEDLDVSYARSLCGRTLLTHWYAVKVWTPAVFHQQAFEVCARCAKAAKA